MGLLKKVLNIQQQDTDEKKVSKKGTGKSGLLNKAEKMLDETDKTVLSKKKA